MDSMRSNAESLSSSNVAVSVLAGVPKIVDAARRQVHRSFTNRRVHVKITSLLSAPDAPIEETRGSVLLVATESRSHR
ncbi:hypothetical protein FRACA_1440002 [Frankia canadensis]|uniref:Uncharacterized protein n=1 Tax=Frankia canadensis TaxID=1836972 RepID=A0A2I2KLJ6_9ACTN|nr:hypothetical protein FRACA_1440002 [Frankia canadensis]SOU53828.1 hypothetical protein FRACA_1440002 [Frankia canadensis]